MCTSMIISTTWRAIDKREEILDKKLKMKQIKEVILKNLTSNKNITRNLGKKMC